MKNSIAAASLIAMLILVASRSATLVVGEDASDGPVDNRIAELQAEYIETLEQVVRVLETMRKDGHVSPQQVNAARSELIEARLELTSRKSERLALLTEHLELAKFAEQLAEAQRKSGLVDPVDCLKAKATRLEREIALARESAGN